MVYSRARYNRMAFGLLARWAWRGFEISFTLSELIVKLLKRAHVTSDYIYLSVGVVP